MLKALLLTKDFKCKEVSINDYRDTRKLVGGNIEMLPTRYNEIKIGKNTLVAYVNESGLIENLSYNEWSSTLFDMGFYVHDNYGIRGDVVLLLNNDYGEDKSINLEVIDMVNTFSHRYRH